MTVQGLGASLSPAIGGWLAQLLGYQTAFYVLGGFALGSIALWAGYGALMRPACAGTCEPGPSGSAPEGAPS